MFTTTPLDLDAIQAAFQMYFTDPIVVAATVIAVGAGAFALVFRMFMRLSRVIG